MSSNVGLTTPRGSGTSGYVQRNLSSLKPRTNTQPYPTSADQRPPPGTRKPDTEILTHDRLREIELQVLELRDDLEESDPAKSESEIETECSSLRTRLIAEMERRGNGNHNQNSNKKNAGVKRYQVHELAEAKIRESERLRRALGLKGEVGDGNGNNQDEMEHPMARQERRKREREEEKARMAIEKEQERSS